MSDFQESCRMSSQIQTVKTLTASDQSRIYAIPVAKTKFFQPMSSLPIEALSENWTIKPH